MVFFSGINSIEDRFVELDVLSPFLTVPPSSLEDQVRLQSWPSWAEGHTRDFLRLLPTELPNDFMIFPLA